jgi:predicted metalloprotease with PDZ domain
MYRIEQTDAELLGTQAEIVYELTFDAAERHLLSIELEVTTRGEPCLEFVLPAWTPGSYKIREFSAHFTLLQAEDERGAPLPVEWCEKHRFRVHCASAERVRLRALYYGNERSVRTTHVDRWHAFVMPSNCLPYVEGRQQELHHVVLRRIPAEWSTVTTALSPVEVHEHRYGALNYDILADSPIEVGSHTVLRCTIDGVVHELAIVSQEPVQSEWLPDAVGRLVPVVRDFWGGSLPYDRYVIIVHVAPGMFGGLEHARSQVLGVEEAAFREPAAAQRFLRLLAHELFHAWNGKRIRPRELGPFDYTREVYTPLLWLVEGVTSYYELLCAYWAGVLTQRELLQQLALDVERLAHTPGRFALSVRDSSLLAWVKLYAASPDGVNRFPSYYLKGELIAWLLDLWIVSHSEGKRRLRDGLLGLWERTRQRPHEGLTEEEVLHILQESTGVPLAGMLRQWLSERAELPYEEILKRVGLQLLWEHPQPTPQSLGDGIAIAPQLPPRFTGLSLRETPEGLLVEAVEDDSPAAHAGIAVGDELLALDGYRVRTRQQWERILAAAGAPLEVLAASNGRVYRTVLAPELERTARVLIRAEDAAQLQLLQAWLQPPLRAPESLPSAELPWDAGVSR